MINSLQIKLCGFREEETINFASKFPIDFLGFIFYKKSPRFVDIKDISQITKNIPAHIKKVAVTVDASDEELKSIIKELKPELLQLHGDEDLPRVKEIKKLFNLPIIKAFRIASKNDLTPIKDFEEIVDYFLFDTKAGNEKGGSGKSFDWNILKDLRTNKPWFLSGGIGHKNIAEALKISGAQIIDLSSSLESTKGVKSKELIQKFISKLEEVRF